MSWTLKQSISCFDYFWMLILALMYPKFLHFQHRLCPSLHWYTQLGGDSSTPQWRHSNRQDNRLARLGVSFWYWHIWKLKCLLSFCLLHSLFRCFLSSCSSRALHTVVWLGVSCPFLPSLHFLFLSSRSISFFSYSSSLVAFALTSCLLRSLIW